MASNGQLDASTLKQAANGASGQVLEAQTANQWAAMVKAAASAGVRLAPEPDDGISSCYRSYANQQYAYDQYLNNNGNVAAVPGTSNHGWGTAVDVAITSTVQNWLNNNAARYGFDNVQGQASGENWHWVKTATVNVPDSATEDDDMLVGIQGKAGERRGGLYYASGGVATFLGGPIPANVPTLTDDGEIKALQGRVSGLM